MQKQYKTGLMWLVLIMVFIGLYRWFPGDDGTQRFDRFTRDLTADNVAGVVIEDDEITVQLRDRSTYTVFGTIGDRLQAQIIERSGRENGPTLRYKKRSDGGNGGLIFWVPSIVIILFLYFMVRATRQPGNTVSHFSKSRARMNDGAQDPVTFADVAGAHAAKAALHDLVSFLREPKRWTHFGAHIPTGCLLVGPPGCGKTLLARAVAGEAGVPFYSISGADFVEMFVGVGAARVRDLFDQGAKNAPCVIFIDELDAVGRKRGSGVGGGNDEREQTLNQLLVSMDGFERNSGVIVIAATNRKDVLDKALIRAGRFDRIVEVPLPDKADRLEILKVHTRATPLAADVRLDEVAADTGGFCGADLENLVNEASLQAVRRFAIDDSTHATAVVSADFNTALGSVREGRRAFATLDLILIESATQLAQPAETVHVRMLLNSGEVLEGELRWADSTFIGYRRRENADEVVIPKASVIKFETVERGRVLGG